MYITSEGPFRLFLVLGANIEAKLSSSMFLGIDEWIEIGRCVENKEARWTSEALVREYHELSLS